MTVRALPRPVSPLADLVALTKPRLSSLVLCTLAGGMWLAPGELSVSRWVATLLGTAGTVGAANALNCWIERDRDRLMARTRGRPLPSGRMEPGVALGFGLALAVFSLPLLALGSNGLTGSLGFLALVSYVAAYTPLKPLSPGAMLVGGIPGALPPLMGWTAVTGHIGAGGLVLFGILFAWQMPHFLAIALFRKDEYRKAGYLALPLVSGDDATRIWMLLWTVLLVALSVLPVPMGVARPHYLGAAAVLGAVFLALVVRGVVRREGKAWARKTFLFSLVYLTGLFAALLLSARAH
ncbi:MAG: heme o synthase [Myxococcaceae bacterium]